MFAIYTAGCRWHDVNGCDSWTARDIVRVSVEVAWTGQHVEVRPA